MRTSLRANPAKGRKDIKYSDTAHQAAARREQPEERAALHEVRETATAVRGLRDFLKLADGFFQESHFPEGDSQVVVGFQIFFFGAHLAEFRAEFLENFLEWAAGGRSSRRRLALCRRLRRGARHRAREARRKFV